MGSFWPVGIEMEALCPPGLTRFDLGMIASGMFGSSVEPEYSLSSESLDEGTQIYALVRSARISRNGNMWCLACDDWTIRDFIGNNTSYSLDWFRIISDDKRILYFIQKLINASHTWSEILKSPAALLGAELVTRENEILCQINGELIAAVIPDLSERARVAELVSPVLNRESENLPQWLDDISSLMAAAKLSCPTEAALHLHFDGSRLRNPTSLGRLVQFCMFASPLLRTILPPNRYCRRIRPFPQEITEFSSRLPGLSSWFDVLPLAMEYNVSKFFDFNIWNLIANHEVKQTFEVRLLPPIYEKEFILRVYEAFSGALVTLTEDTNAIWQSKCFAEFEAKMRTIACRWNP